MDAQFRFFGNPDIAMTHRPVMAGLNYFLTHEARGGDSKKLLGEKRDVKVWLSWLERYAHNEVSAIETPIGNLPEFGDLRDLFNGIIGKTYDQELYTKQFSLYTSNIIGRIELQETAYAKEENIPQRLFDILSEQKTGLEKLRERFGEIITPDQLTKA